MLPALWSRSSVVQLLPVAESIGLPNEARRSLVADAALVSA